MAAAIFRRACVETFASWTSPELVACDAKRPEMTVVWSLRRNVDGSAGRHRSRSVQLRADFPGGALRIVSDPICMITRGSPLAALAVKVTDGFFVIGLSAVDPDMQRNEQLLKGRSWFYIPIVYTNGGRAILAMEKGPPGDRAFVEAFAYWEKK